MSTKNTKESIIKTFEYLSEDPIILDYLGLNLSSPLAEKEDRIGKTRQHPNIADNLVRLRIWEDKAREINSRVNRNMLVVDTLVPLEVQNETGIALSIAERVEELLVKKPIGRKLAYRFTIPDVPTDLSGWYKSSVIFTYHRAK